MESFTVHVESKELIAAARKCAENSIKAEFRSMVKSLIDTGTEKALFDVGTKTLDRFRKHWPGSDYEKQYQKIIYETMMKRMADDTEWKQDIKATCIEHIDMYTTGLNIPSLVKKAIDTAMRQTYDEAFSKLADSQRRLDNKIAEIEEKLSELKSLKENTAPTPKKKSAKN